ncbi:MAG: right-handed parallel beta-helix repeat-containing protein [Flavobacteriales bacterium]|nr:right-handed parallel beta-helix repeat-containing protein [Flavobacteriales bacterium]
MERRKMQLQIFSIVFLLISVSFTIAQTAIPAGNVSGTWTAANSPYQVQGLIVVQDGQTLTVEPGTIIQFGATGRLRIKGNVLASGTSLDPITFTAQNQVSGWKSIFMDSVNVASDSTIFEYCTIEYGKGTGLFRITNFSKVRIENCTLQYGQAFGAGCAFFGNTSAIFKNNLVQYNTCQNNGGAFSISGTGSCVFEENTIIHNSADNYGGAFTISSPANPILSNNIISFNDALTGGAIHCWSFCSFTLDGNTFEGNTSTYDGAVLWAGNAFLTVTNNTFINNVSGDDGAVAFFQSYTNSNFNGNYYTGNGGDKGGAFYLLNNSQINLENETFHANSVSQSGAAIYATDNCTINVENSTFTNNTSSATIVLSGNCIGNAKNCLFANNQGIVASITNSCQATYTNCNFVNNQVTPAIGIMATTSGSNSDFINCIFKGNVGGGTYYNGSIEYNGWNPSSASFTHCNIEGGLSSINYGTGPAPVYTNNINQVPQFIAPSSGAGDLFDGLNADWRIGSNSPCLNAGTPDTLGLNLPSTDLGGGARLVLDTVDIGAYEVFLEAEVLTTSQNAVICSGDSVTISITTGGVPPINFQWQFNGTDIPSATADSLTILGTMPNAGDYRCIVSNGYNVDTSSVIPVVYVSSPILSTLGADFNICQGDSTTLFADSGPFNYNWNNGLSTADSLVVNAIGSYYYSVQDTNGCAAKSDTIIIEENPLPNISIVGDTLCQGESFTIYADTGYATYDWNNGLANVDSLVVTTTGDYFVEVTDVNGCSNKDTAHVMFYSLPMIDLGGDQEVCIGDSIEFVAPTGFVVYDWNNGLGSTNSLFASTAGDWFVEVTDTNGCVSSDTVNLTLLTPTAGVDVVTACNSHTWIDGNTYTANNNTATFTLLNNQGCDSVVTLNLAINTPTSGTDVVSACESYTWLDGNTYISSNNTAQWVLTNAQGCDSVVTLDLTILQPTFDTDVHAACNNFTWIDGNTYTSSNNSAQWILTNAQGCDSIVTLDLTIVNSNSGTDVISACESYTWIDGNTYTSSNNTATYVLQNTFGCDSTVTLDLTINPPSQSTDEVTACFEYTWIDGLTYYSDNDTSTFLLTNAFGCDSIVTLDLTINTVNTTITNNDPELVAPLGMSSYQWLDCDNNFAQISGETSASFVAQQNGLYAVQIDDSGCVDTSSCEAINQVGIFKLGETFNWTIHPNPTADNVTVQFHDQIGEVKVEIMNPLGQTIQSESYTDSSEVVVTLGSESGLFFITVISEKGRSRIPIVKI